MNLKDRDYELLKLLSKTGAVTYEQVQQIYGTKNYHYHRLARLEEAGYLLKTRKYVRITGKGASAVGCELTRISPYMLGHYSKFAELIMNLKNYEAIPQKDLRQKYQMERRNNYQGGLRCNLGEYFVYILTERVTRNKMVYIKTEIDHLAVFKQLSPQEAKDLRGVILLTTSPQLLDDFPVADYRTLEVMLLPYPDGIEILDSWADDTYHQYLRSLIPKPNAVSLRPFAHYETPDSYHVFLMINDLNKKYRLASYFRANANIESKAEPKPVYIYCFEEQAEYFARQFPYAFIQTVSPVTPADYLPPSVTSAYTEAVNQ